MVQPLIIAKVFFRFNVSARVGKGQLNALDDVELVRFGYAMVRQNPTTNRTNALFAELSKMNTKGPFGPDLASVIVAHQKQRGGTQDGCVSPEVDNGRVEKYDGVHSWVITSLSNQILEQNKSIFPRIDLHNLAGPALVKSVRKILLLEE